MKRKRFSVEQIAFAITQTESATPVAAICREMGGVGADLLAVEEEALGYCAADA